MASRAYASRARLRRAWRTAAIAWLSSRPLVSEIVDPTVSNAKAAVTSPRERAMETPPPVAITDQNVPRPYAATRSWSNRTSRLMRRQVARAAQLRPPSAMPKRATTVLVGSGWGSVATMITISTAMTRPIPPAKARSRLRRGRRLCCRSVLISLDSIIMCSPCSRCDPDGLVHGSV